MRFTIEKKIKNALGRAGTLETPHGAIHTPAFVAVGTKATVKALTPAQLTEIGAEVVLGNTYHLHREPGEKILKKSGGLGKFMGWSGPTMTDSGGFQVFSLGSDFDKNIGKINSGKKSHSDVLKNIRMKSDGEKKGEKERNASVSSLAKIDEDGVTFKSPKDGSTHRLTPERSIEIQHAIGADIIFAFDECVSPDASKTYQREAMERTNRWAARSLRKHRELKVEGEKLKVKNESTPALFGIIQGGRFEDLRKESARVIGKMCLSADSFDGLAPHSGFAEFAGFGIGGSFEKKDIDTVVGLVNRLLPEEKPRHLLGIGEPLDLFGAVENGCDLFDCVAPTRQARNGSLYTKNGRINITNARYKNDVRPIDEGCGCYTCKNFTKAYVAHLFRSNEILSNTLATIHNLYFIVTLVKKMRLAILDGTFYAFKKSFLSYYRT